MSKKLFVCKNCSYNFPERLNQLIEKGSRVFCERCGSLFTLEGIKFEDKEPKHKTEEKSRKGSPNEKSSSLDSIIKVLNKISWIPILILSIIFLLFIPSQFLLGISGILISLYDIKFISKRVKQKDYNKILLDSLCFGILGCIIYGTGAILLIKGLLIFIKEAKRPKERKYYDFGLDMKNSLNKFSAFAGVIIILIAYNFIIQRSDIFMIRALIILSIFSVVVILIDLFLREGIRKKSAFKMSDAITIIFIGILGVMFAAAGIFILIKGFVILLLVIGKPSEINKISVEGKPIESTPQIRVYQPQSQEEEIKIDYIEPKKLKKEEIEKPIEEEIPPIEPLQKTPEAIKKDLQSLKEVSPKKDEKQIDREKDAELRLHESLLPVKNEKDKELVKQYFSKIFTVLSKDLRSQIKNLNIPEKDKKELLTELVFLSKEEQAKFIEAIINLYREIPVKLIERIKNIPNVKPEHYVKIAEQLKFLDLEEQEKFIQSLENNA